MGFRPNKDPCTAKEAAETFGVGRQAICRNIDDRVLQACQTRLKSRMGNPESSHSGQAEA